MAVELARYAATMALRRHRLLHAHTVVRYASTAISPRDWGVTVSVFITATIKVDPEALRGLFESKREEFVALAEVAKSVGALHHRFAAGDGEVLILDEWESAEAFHQFFDGRPEIAALMQEAGVQEPPDIHVWQPMDDAPDAF